MVAIIPGVLYSLFELGGAGQRLFIEARKGVRAIDLISIASDRTKYLNNVLECNESKDAMYFLESAKEIHQKAFGVRKSSVHIFDAGHVYRLKRIDGDYQILRFVKRSGGAIIYKKEWPGIQTQEILRALIDYFDFLIETTEKKKKPTSVQDLESIILDLKNTLFLYEVRAYRRKHEHVNREKGVHDDTVRAKYWNERIFEDIPFSVEGIDSWDIGKDGHIIFENQAVM